MKWLIEILERYRENKTEKQLTKALYKFEKEIPPNMEIVAWTLTSYAIQPKSMGN